MEDKRKKTVTTVATMPPSTVATMPPSIDDFYI